MDIPTQKPLLKWVGGKTQILENVVSLFPTTINNYHEPFLGGGSVLLGMLSQIQSGRIQISGKIYASDLNKHLIAFYRNVQSYPREVIEETHKIVNVYQSICGTDVKRKPVDQMEAMTSKESYYYWIRKLFNNLNDEESTTPLASAMFLFLNKTCFRGIYREGPRGFNVPFGNYKNPSILNEDHICSISELIQDVVFHNQPFQTSFESMEEGDFVYIDPPYVPETETSFVSYTYSGFSLEHHTELFNLCHTLKERGIKMVMSNADVQLVKNAFPTPLYSTHTILCRRAIHSKKPDTKTNEVLITNHL